MFSGPDLDRMASELSRTLGVVGVVLGGSRARGDDLPSSDVDLGVYYEDGFDPRVLSPLASQWSGTHLEVGPPGSWGPWVDAGAWLSVEGTDVDWILRNLTRVGECWERAKRGQFAFHSQPGHPLGFLDVAYVGELALGQILTDPSGRLSALQQQARRYPPQLAASMMASVWEAGLLIDAASKGARRGDTTYVGLCVGRALMVCAHALHARAGRWVTNEKGVVPAVARLPRAPGEFSAGAAAIMSALGADPDSLEDAVAMARGLVQETERELAGTASP